MKCLFFERSSLTILPSFSHDLFGSAQSTQIWYIFRVCCFDFLSYREYIHMHEGWDNVYAEYT